MSKIICSCAVTQLEGKKRKLKEAGDGYFEILVGAFGLFVNGYHWDYNNEIEKMFRSGARLQRDVVDGKLYAEADHPEMAEWIDGKRTPELVEALWMDRLTKIMQKNAVGHFRKLALVPLRGEHRNDRIVGVMSEYKPLTEAERCAIDTPDINPAYSVRSFSRGYKRAGIDHQAATHIVTYDRVTRGGVGQADKYGTPSLQSAVVEVTGMNLIDFSNQEIYKGEQQIALHSGEPIIAVAKIKDDFGWRDVPIHNIEAGARSILSKWRG